MEARDVLVLHDGGKEGNKSKLLSSVPFAKKTVHSVAFALSETSLDARMALNRGFTSMQQNHNLLHVANLDLG